MSSKTKVVAIRRWWIAEYLIQKLGAERMDITPVGETRAKVYAFLRLNQKAQLMLSQLKQGNAPSYRLQQQILRTPVWGHITVTFRWSPIKMDGYTQIIEDRGVGASRHQHPCGWFRVRIEADDGTLLESPDDTILETGRSLKKFCYAVNDAYGGYFCEWDPNTEDRIPVPPLKYGIHDLDGSGVYAGCEDGTLRYTMVKTSEKWLAWRYNRSR